MASSINSTSGGQSNGAGLDDGSADPSHVTDFNAAASGGSGQGLVVNGNEIDTGRYIITGTNNYTQPNSNSTADDGMVKIYDTVNHSYVEVYGDPHLYTSDGDRGDFQADGLTLELADGTEVQFKPTAEVNGVAHIDAIAVTKNNQTVVQSGYYLDKGDAKVVTSGLEQGGPSSAAGFNDIHDTVLKVGYAGNLGTLVNAMGMQFNSKNSEDLLDGMGGGITLFGTSSSTTGMQEYAKALASNAGAGGGPNAADEPNQAGSIRPSVRADASASNTSLTSLVSQLISLLQQLPAPGTSNPPAGAAPAADQSQLISLLQQLLSDLQGGANSGGSSSDEASLIRQLIPLLQQQLGGAGPAGEKDLAAAPAGGSGNDEAGLIQQLITMLQAQGGQSGPAAQLGATPAR